MENKSEKDSKKEEPSTPYKDVLVLSDTSEVSLFNNRNYRNSVLIILNSPQMCLTVCIFGTGAGPKLRKDDGLDPFDWAKSCSVRGWMLKVRPTRSSDCLELQLFPLYG